MRHLARALITALVSLSAQPVIAECEAYWLRLHGKDEHQALRLPHGFRLLQFARNQPRWQPPHYRTGQVIDPAPSSPLHWRPLERLASLTFVGLLEGRRVYAASYSPYSIAILTEQEEWFFCPTLLLDADAGFGAGQVVAGLGMPEIFTSKDRGVLSLRIYYRGNGALQESVFLSVVEGHAVFLEQEPFAEQLRARGWQLRTRGGGFCRESLRWSNLAERDDPSLGVVQGAVSVVYAVADRRLAIESLSVATGEQLHHTEPCDIHYE